MSKQYSREPIAWITRGGKHVPIFDDDIKVGDMVEEITENEAGMAKRGGVNGKVVKVNPKTVEIETLYGGWGGKEPEKMIIKLSKSKIRKIKG